MSIVVIQEAPDQLLTTVAAVKANLGIPRLNVEKDELIDDNIKAASAFIATYCNRVFGKEQITESVVGKGLPNILVSRIPVFQVVDVKLDSDVQEGITIFNAAAGILQCEVGFISTEFRVNAFDRPPSSYGQKRWHVTYEGGYVLPNWPRDTLGERLPYDLERACIDMVKTHTLTAALDTAMSSYKIGDTTAAWRTGSGEGEVAGMPPRAMSVLNYYRISK